MGKWVASDVLDGALQVIAGANLMVALPSQPASYAEAFAGRLAEAVLTSADFAVGAGDVSGRKIEVLAQSSIMVLSAGLASHVALLDSAGSRLLYVTTCPTQSLPLGGTVNFDRWTVEIGAPV
jgi:hypothetical protein